MFLNFAQPFVLPPYWANKPIKVLDKSQPVPAASELIGNLYQCPLYVRWEDQPDEFESGQGWWRLPFDPVISVSGGNTIIRTDVLRQDNGRSERRGTVKEVWSQQDYQVQIAGMFIGADGYFPIEDVNRLRDYCEARKVLLVCNDLLEAFGIHRLAIESYDFAHTPGYENQQFAIKAYSDEDFSLLIEN
jgi:hypothetical protein